MLVGATLVEHNYFFYINIGSVIIGVTIGAHLDCVCLYCDLSGPFTCYIMHGGCIVQHYEGVLIIVQCYVASQGVGRVSFPEKKVLHKP